MISSDIESDCGSFETRVQIDMTVRLAVSRPALTMVRPSNGRLTYRAVNDPANKLTYFKSPFSVYSSIRLTLACNLNQRFLLHNMAYSKRINTLQRKHYLITNMLKGHSSSTRVEGKIDSFSDLLAVIQTPLNSLTLA